MINKVLYKAKDGLNGELDIPGDKSISHRAIILGSLAKGQTKVTNFLTGEDCIQTINAFKELGVTIDVNNTDVEIDSPGIHSFIEPKKPLYFGNSGTTARLMIGLLAGLPLFSTIWGDPYLTERPMDRVINPLKKMGAKISGRTNTSLLPLAIDGGKLAGIHYELPVKSAQVKSAILLAGLFAKGKTTVLEQTKTRDHTENMLSAFGADIEVNHNTITVTNSKDLQPTNVFVPGDISSAAFFLVAAAIVPNSSVTLKNIGLNETRTGIIDVMKQMGADIRITNISEISGEQFGDITVQSSELQGIRINGDIIPRLIDEIPVIALLATQASGETIIEDAEELRVKETDRIAAVEDVLTNLGVEMKTTEDGMIIRGKQRLHGGKVKAYYDHRIAMMASIASLISDDAVTIDDVSSIPISYPDFFEHLNHISLSKH